MSVLLQHRVLRILWYLPVTSYFAPLWGPSLWWEYTLIFLILWPLPALTSAYLLKIHIHATCSHSTALCYTTLLWAPVGAVWLPLSNVLVSHKFCVYSFLKMYTHIILHLFYFFIHLFLVVLGLHCCKQDFFRCGGRGLLFHWCSWLPHWWFLLLQSTGSRCTGFSSCSSAQALELGLSSRGT